MLHWQISSVRDVQTWAAIALNLTPDKAAEVARAIWERDDFPHPVNNTDLTEYLNELDEEFIIRETAEDEGDTPERNARAAQRQREEDDDREAIAPGDERYYLEGRDA